MGRTNPTYRDLLESVEEQWGTYRRGLRRDDKDHFDRLFAHARRHADASGLQNHDDPLAAVLLSVALEQEKELAALEARIDALETTERAAEGATEVATAEGATGEGATGEGATGEGTTGEGTDGAATEPPAGDRE